MEAVRPLAVVENLPPAEGNQPDPVLRIREASYWEDLHRRLVIVVV